MREREREREIGRRREGEVGREGRGQGEGGEEAGQVSAGQGGDVGRKLKLLSSWTERTAGDGAWN